MMAELICWLKYFSHMDVDCDRYNIKLLNEDWNAPITINH